VSVIGEVVAAFTVQSAAAFTRLGAPTGVSISADVAAVKALLPTVLVGGRIDANIGSVKGTTVGSGVGTAGNPWGP